jgi:glycosyltransferase involved in cell wall biosynthesis
VKLSICIPTYNRARNLANCLHSIALNVAASRADVEVCVSDNCSTDDTEQVVREAQSKLRIKYRKNPQNLGIPRNFLNVVAMAEGEFAWLIGDDDLLLPTTVEQLLSLLEQHPSVDFFYVNSFHLTTQYVFARPQPFDTAQLPTDMQPFSSRRISGELPFMDLIDPKVSFDFLGGMFLAVFRRAKWLANTDALDREAIMDSRTFSHFDNTFPHVKIFSRAFARSRAYFRAEPLSVCLTGAREWSPMYPLVASVRLVQALEEYRKNGLPLLRYLRCRNSALHNFIPDLGAMFLRRKQSGFAYIQPLRLLWANALFPNVYLSPLRFLLRKARLLLGGAVASSSG